ncbi:PD-(D/E)XK motif protein [Mariprofundus erugo]|uniref:PD-(D/E)XK motif protein n=1 Tax=Mariprofundus erugo TaxID=2528639 RepID=A0A5R9GWC1_9PROT|nr:PD-(D/E)XK motif protein [Mariprofundus erugo]TLS68327.1 PD-(D/E)XK motif protein [Mariprofundus erugo]
MMKTKIELLWDELRNKRDTSLITNSEFLLLRVNTKGSHIINAGIADSGKLMLALEVDIRPPDIGLETRSLVYFRHQRANGKWLMVLRLDGDELEQVFGRLCQDLIDEAEQVITQTKLISLFQNRLSLWKKLFQMGNNGCLEKYQVKGLIAELLALQSLLGDTNDQMEEAVYAWVGPLKRDQDFVFVDRAIEVKAIAPSVEHVGISSIDQLDSKDPLELWIFTLQDASPSDLTSICIIDLVTDLEGQLAKAGHRLLSQFRRLLLESGYIEQECYEAYRFNLKECSKYHVVEGFPRLTHLSLPTGIARASYSIALSAMDPFRQGE